MAGRPWRRRREPAGRSDALAHDLAVGRLRHRACHPVRTGDCDPRSPHPRHGVRHRAGAVLVSIVWWYVRAAHTARVAAVDAPVVTLLLPRATRDPRRWRSTVGVSRRDARVDDEEPLVRPSPRPADQPRCASPLLAFVLDVDGAQPIERSSDDGEPAGTGGCRSSPRSRIRLVDVVCVVTRWFGRCEARCRTAGRAYGDAAGWHCPSAPRRARPAVEVARPRLVRRRRSSRRRPHDPWVTVEPSRRRRVAARHGVPVAGRRELVASLTQGRQSSRRRERWPWSHLFRIAHRSQA